MFTPESLSDFYKDIDELYVWMDSIYKVECKPKCNACCKRDIIWLLSPELVRLNTIATPKEVNAGCPFQSKFGCSVYKYRPLICRSFGATQLLSAGGVRMLTIQLENRLQNIAGPGVCDDVISSFCNVKELNDIYACYLSLAKKYGLTAMGVCEDISLQQSQEEIIAKMQKSENRFEIYARKGVPNMQTKLIKEYNSFFEKGNKK